MNSTVTNLTSQAQSTMNTSSIRLALMTVAVIALSLAATGVVAAQAHLLCGSHF